MKVENCSTISAYPSFLSRNLDNGSDVIIRCPFFLPHCHELKTSVHQRTKVICRSCGICYHTPKELGGISSTHVSHEQMLSVSDSLWPHGLLQAPLSIEFSRQDYWLAWVPILFSRGSSQPRDWTWISHTAGRFFTIWATREAHVGFLYLIVHDYPDCF